MARLYFVVDDTLIEVIRSLQGQIETSLKDGAFPDILILGPPGIGKTTLLSILADEVIPASSINETNFPTYIQPVGNGFEKRLHGLLQALNDGKVVLLDDIHKNPMLQDLLNSYIGRQNIKMAVDESEYNKKGIIIATATDLSPFSYEFLSRFVAFKIEPTEKLVKGLIVLYLIGRGELENVKEYFEELKYRIGNKEVIFLKLKSRDLPKEVEELYNIMEAFKKEKGTYPIRELVYSRDVEDFRKQLEDKYNFRYVIDDIRDML